jgi:small subunit ribosomal protein S20
MANTAQARKRARQSEKRRQLNASLRSMVRSAMKKVTKAVAAGDKTAAETAFRESTGVVDRIADKRRIIHKNKAARFKSRLAARIKAMA